MSEYNRAIKDKDKELDNLHHHQFNHMISGETDEMNRMDKRINQVYQQKEQLENEMRSAMGLGEDGWYTNRDEMQNNPVGVISLQNRDVDIDAEVQLNDDEYPPEPYPSPIPGAPPVPEDHPDMEHYDQQLDEYTEYELAHDQWEDEVDRIDKENGQKDVPDSLQCFIQSKYVQYALDEINGGGGISGEAGTYIYESNGVTIEIEIMDERALGKYGGSYTGDQELVKAIISEISGPIGAGIDLFTALAQLADPDYNPGAILEKGDVRIRIGDTVEINSGSRAGNGKDYFFKDGKLLYSKTNDQNDLTWSSYGTQLNEEYRNSGKNWLNLAKAIPFVDLFKALN